MRGWQGAKASALPFGNRPIFVSYGMKTGARLISPIILLCILTGVTFAQTDTAIPANLSNYIRSIHLDELPGSKPQISWKKISTTIAYCHIHYDIPQLIMLNDWQLKITPAFTPSFHWAPLLTPSAENIIAQHVFRSPALIVADQQLQFSVIPDLDLAGKTDGQPWYMDMDAPGNILTIGLSKSVLSAHVQYKRDKGMQINPGALDIAFYVIAEEALTAISPWRSAEAFLWDKWGKPLFEKGEPLSTDPAIYAGYTYQWAFHNWRNAVWQQFIIAGKKVGAPVFIVNTTQSPSYKGPVNEREFRSVWNQAWFNSLRSAAGLYRYARRNHIDSLLQKARLTKELALAFPQKDGLFPAVIGTEMETVKVNGKDFNRSKGWKTYYFGNSNRNPQTLWGSSKNAPLHILDMSWTADRMLEWYEELEKDTRLLEYATRYADKLLTLQDSQGYFPAWLDAKSLMPLNELRQSPETAASVSFLFRLYSISKNEKYKNAAMQALKAIAQDIVPSGRWEDFETYWSCSTIFGEHLGRKIERNDQFKQNTLSMFWAADAFYKAFELTNDKGYLKTGRRVMDELLMYQACWQPPFIYIHALGGFGVMNGDGEWNDSRQSLFAELIIRYGKTLANQEYIQRGIAAMKASFVMMYCPENPQTKAQWERVFPFFGPKDYGFMMENYGHDGMTSPYGMGIGEFTIYDWGNGAASEAYNRIVDHFGMGILTGK